MYKVPIRGIKMEIPGGALSASFERGEFMRLALTAAVLVFLFYAPSSTPAQILQTAPSAQTTSGDSQSVQNHIITVSRSGEATAKPDLGILMMSIRSTSAIAEEAVAENGRKATAVESALSGLGFAPASYQISSVNFGQAGGPRFPGQAEVTAYDATQYVYVFFEAADLNDVARLTTKSAAVIEALRKAGAVPANSGPGFAVGPMPAAMGALMIYTVKDPTEYEHKALQVAIARARDAAQDIAVGTGVQIIGLRNVQSGYLGGNVVPRSGSSPLEGLRYRFFSPKSDELQITANATVEYDFK
jgi:uncharacterized protein YggE